MTYSPSLKMWIEFDEFGDGVDLVTLPVQEIYKNELVLCANSNTQTLIFEIDGKREEEKIRITKVMFEDIK